MALPEDTAPTPFTWGSNGARLTADDIAARRKVADALAAQAGDTGAFPVGTRGAGLWTQGLARVAKGLESGLINRQANDAAQQNADDNKAMFERMAGLINGGAAPAQNVATQGTVPAAVAAAPAAADTTGKIYSNDEPSPLDPPSGQDRINMIATALGEEKPGSPESLGAINTIRNRAVDGGYGGDTPSAVVLAPKQYSANNDPANRAALLARATANTPEVAKVQDAIDQAYGTGKYVSAGPNDPTEGKTHYYDPASMVPANSVPRWAQGKEYQTIGSTRFFDDPNDPAAAPAAPVQVAGPVPPGVANVAAAAQADPAALPANSAPTQGYAVPGQPAPVAPGVAKVAGAIDPAVLQAYTSPYADPQTKALAGMLLSRQMTPKSHFTQETDDKGNVWNVDQTSGQRTVALKTDAETPKWGIVGKDQYGQPTYGYAPTREEYAAKQAAAAANPTAPPDDLTNVHGKDYLDTIAKQDPKYASTVQAIIEGRAPYPTGMLLKTPYGQKLAQDVTQADPTFESGNATARVKVRNEFESGGIGSPAGQITAGNAAIRHAGEMSDSLEEMKAQGGVLPAVGESNIPYLSYWANQMHNSAVQGTASGAPLNDFKTAKNHFSEEVTKFYAGSAGAEAERARALANIDEAKSLPELRSAIRKEAGLMQDKVNVLQDRWRTGMGPLVADFPLINSKSQAAFDKINQRAALSDAGRDVAGNGTPQAVAPAATPPAAVAKLAQNPTPEMKAHFDEIFGAGAADRALGGK